METKRICPLYQVIFEDDTDFKGGTYLETKWTNMPHKKIKRIYYRLPDGNYLCLNNYEEYYHVIEATKALTGNNKGKIVLEYAYIMGKRKNIVTRFQISLRKSGERDINDICRREFNIDDEYIKKLNSNGWR